MKINSSTISMDSGRFYANTLTGKQQSKRTQLATGNTAYSSTSYLFSYAEYSGSSNSNLAAKQYDEFVNSKNNAESSTAEPTDLYTKALNAEPSIYDVRSAIDKFHEELRARLEELMERIRQQLLSLGKCDDNQIVDLSGNQEPGALWKKETYESSTYMETETTCFSTTGTVTTADGRTIDFNIDLEMSRSFMETTESLTSETEYILTDPLVIQLDNAPDTISDQKWFFDIDADGKKEEISELAKGNAFLAMDKNDNGKIDDGSELFGTKSGNGFKDLAAYDEDKNGWIDENDSVYNKLKIWVKDADGNDKLMDLKQGDVGAIYLGSSNTQFSHKTLDTNETLAVTQKTGFFLHESNGNAGTIQQIDFATA